MGTDLIVQSPHNIIVGNYRPYTPFEALELCQKRVFKRGDAPGIKRILIGVNNTRVIIDVISAEGLNSIQTKGNMETYSDFLNMYLWSDTLKPCGYLKPETGKSEMIKTNNESTTMHKSYDYANYTEIEL